MFRRSISLIKDNKEYKKKKNTVFCKTDLNHFDVAIPAEPTETGNNSNDTDVVPEQIETGPDEESSLDEVEFLDRKNIKIELDESQCEGNSNSDSEISLQKIWSDILSSFTKTRKGD